MRFGQDATGVFIRGDNAYHYWLALERQLSGQGTVVDLATLKRLQEILASSNEHQPQKGRQNLRDFAQCTLGREGAHYLIYGLIEEPVGCCSVQEDVLSEEPHATFEEVEKEKCPICSDKDT